MSLIIGVNLCDRLYICGDTRMSQKKDGVLVAKKDQIIKVAYFTPLIMASFAADAHMSAYIARELKKVLPQDLDIRSFHERVQEFIAPIANKYWTESNPSASVTIIFGGLNPSQKKKFEWKDIYSKIMAYSSARKEKPSMNMKPALFNMLMQNEGKPLRYPEPSDSLVFSVQIFPPNGFHVEKAEWGQYLAYGPKGLTKNDINEVIFGMIEFDAGSIGKDNAAIAAVLGSLIDERKEETVSKAFFNGVISDDVQGVILGKISRLNIATMQNEFISEITRSGNSFYSRQEDGSLRKLTFIADYKDFGALDIL